MKTTKTTTKIAGTSALQIETPRRPAPKPEYIDALFRGGVKMGNVTYCAIPVSMLEIENNYQRIQCDHVRAIAANWDYSVCGSIKVNHRDGRLYVKDGQNRVAAAKLAGIDSIMCAVTEGEDIDREIDAFVDQNRYVTKISPYDVFYARWHKSNDTTAHKLKELFDKYGIVYQSANAGKKVGDRYIARAPGPNVAGRLNCMHMMMEEADLGHLDLLDNVFETIRQMEWSTMKYSYSTIFMGPLIGAHRACDVGKLREQFHRVFTGQTPETVIVQARSEFNKLGVRAALTAYFNKILDCM